MTPGADDSQPGRATLEHELRRQQADAERQRRLYEAILGNTPDLAYVWDLQHRFIYVNQGLLRMWGRSWDDAVGKTCLELGYEPWHAALHDREIDHVVATRETVRGEVPFNGTFGRRIYDYILVPVLDEDGQVEAVAGTKRDVTEHKRGEAEREALLVSERAARAEAERASRSREEFLAMLSHELRTPLNAILGWSKVLQTTPPSPETLALGLRVIDRNVRMQAQLIADLLDMSRILSGTMRIDLERVAVRVAIDAALDAVRASADTKGVAIEHTPGAGAGEVAGDPARLQQIVWNLLSNAIRFTPAGGVVRVDTRDLGTTVEIVIADSGVGITSDFLPQVFDRFRQADTTTAREHHGLGLGLAIVKQLVELHGGTITAASDGPQRGATFVVRLPAASGETARPPYGEPAEREDRRADLSGLRVLAVDDDDDARDLIARILRDRGARVITAASADAGLAALASESVDVILSDIGMPRRSGYDFMNDARRRGVKAPAVAVTAFARTEDRLNALAAGYQTHLAKPVDPAELVAVVAALAQTRVTRAP